MWSLESCFKLCVRRRGWLFKEKQRDPLHPKRRKYLPPYCSWKHLDFPLHLVLHESDTSGSFSKLTCSQMECKGPACFYISVCCFKPRMMLQIAVGVGYGAKCSTWSLNFIKVPSHRLRLLDVIQSACSIFLSCELWPWFNLDRPYVPTHSSALTPTFLLCQCFRSYSLGIKYSQKQSSISKLSFLNTSLKALGKKDQTSMLKCNL